jgi:hypothetical protein
MVPASRTNRAGTVRARNRAPGVAILERTSGNDQASRGVRQTAQHIRRLITIIENLVSELEAESI